ncbi:2OG-Fe(II) oxygenase superfamily protein [Cyanophage S-RIM32]|jgi:hypothetical protein|uniref:2OG-Fe(II) oxygenase superfamily protein n=1 Tax=Cyanophage S-RIM32 TaxID=1278479 RepID=A0A127KM49_9CAUD|nr:2OG-Fe(II) oxygenase [Cyanophage S-RIM32]AMO43038.1 2OG-Fe(II) oxygenase superfamily protein [Cyanophage S-RIM32]
MKLIKHTNWIYEYENAVSDEIVDEIFNVCTKRMQGRNLIQNERNERRKNYAYYFRMFEGEPEVEYIENQCYKIAYDALGRYYEDCPLSSYNIMTEYDMLSNFVYRHYDTNDHYIWHVDKAHTDLELKIAFILYLNDDFEGGNTLFLSDKLKVKPKRGSILMFPCGPYFIHKSTKVRSGEKHIIWNCFGQLARLEHRLNL